MRSSKPVVLVGLPGAGKTRVGRAVAGHLNLEHADTDELVVEKAGRSIPSIFSESGEPEFRRLEADAVERALREYGVVSVGGGALETPRVLELLKDATVVYIEADHEELLRRVTRNSKRPLLRDDPDKKLRELSAKRIPTFMGAADITVRTSRAPVREVVEQIVKRLAYPTEIVVAANPPYPVLVGSDTTRETIGEVSLSGRKIFLIASPHVDVSPVEQRLKESGKEVHVRVVPAGEEAKTLEVAAQLWDDVASLGLGRADHIVTVGGGATTDLGGFIAATWLRGIGVIHVPTTVLAMVDAAVGGKTGINSVAGKNLIGAFHNPLLVLADLDWLRTLPQEEYAAGLAEVAKCGFIADPRILEIIENNPSIVDHTWGTGVGASVLRELIERAIEVKARVVAVDFKESGLRETLNYGHTLAHAIERHSDYTFRHGEAVAVGMMLAARLAEQRGLLTEDDVNRHRRVLEILNLPVSYRAELPRLLEVMQSDKKTRADQLRFVLLEGIGKASTFPVTEQEVFEAAKGIVL